MIRRSLALATLLLLLSCKEDRTDPSGTYVGEGTLTIVKDGRSKETVAPKDTIVVRTKSRHYQFVEIDVTARGCTVSTTGGTGGTTSWPLFSSAPCSIEVSSTEKIKVALSGGLQRQPPSQTEVPKEMYLSLSGRTESGESISYEIHAKPQAQK